MANIRLISTILGLTTCFLGFTTEVSAQVQTVWPDEQVVVIPLAPGQGVTISFRALGETINTVWADNQTFFTLNSDGCLGGVQQPCDDSTGATLLHLRRINSLDIPGLPDSETAQLTVVTENSDIPYLFQIVPASTSTSRIYEVIPQPGLVDWQLLAALRRGIDEARSRNSLSSASPLWGRLATLEGLLERGYPTRYAIEQSGISLQLFEHLTSF